LLSKGMMICRRLLVLALWGNRGGSESELLF
jgi:hypothetical protein